MLQKKARKLGCILIIIFLVLGIFSIFYIKSYKFQNSIKIFTDIDYLQTEFPNIDGIKNGKYYYKQISSDRDIGLVRADFCGVMEIDKDFSEKLQKEYEWDSIDADNSIVSNLALLGEDYKNYTFLHCDEFCNDGKYKSHSKGGDFYFDPVNKIIYFQIEFS